MSRIVNNMSKMGITFEIQPDPPLCSKTAWIQIGYGAWVNLTVVAIGLAFGWPAVAVPQLMLKNSTIALTFEEQAWIASVLTLCSPIGCLLSGFLMDRFGRKFVLILCEIPMCLGWIYIATAKSATHIIIGRTISGIGIGLALSAPRTYITEMTLPNMRGVVGGIPSFAVSLGITLQAALGTFLNWDILSIIGAVYTGLLAFSTIFLPESPYYILMKGTTMEAKRVLKKFRAANYNINNEIMEMEDYKTTNEIRRLSCKDTMREIIKPSSCKPFGISITYLMIAQIVGVNVITMWAVEMFEMSKSSVDPNMGNILLGVTRLVVSVCTSLLLYKVGRRTMALVSATGVGVTSISLCVFLKLHNDFSIYPLLFFISYIAFAALGYYTLPFLIMFEILPLQVRSILGSTGVSFLTVTMFAVNKWYPEVRTALGLPYTIGVFGISSLTGAIILYIILPETMNLTLQEIEEYFNSTRPTLVSQRSVMSSQLLLSTSALPTVQKPRKSTHRKSDNLKRIDEVDTTKENTGNPSDATKETTRTTEKPSEPTSEKRDIVIKDKADENK